MDATKLQLSGTKIPTREVLVKGKSIRSGIGLKESKLPKTEKSPTLKSHKEINAQTLSRIQDEEISIKEVHDQLRENEDNGHLLLLMVLKFEIWEEIMGMITGSFIAHKRRGNIGCSQCE